MAKKPVQDFESTLKELEQIVQNLESGDLPLEEALNEFESAIKLVQEGQERLAKAEQRIQILMRKDEDSPLVDYQPNTPKSAPVTQAGDDIIPF
ncbi:exodeoxyribonuclease VII small subunit [Pasteurellaceae bacterium LFhippo2]|nr:exodeoxyribonuclease VII small subunit [Pasteurellaceae bacterium LFhippo2]